MPSHRSPNPQAFAYSANTKVPAAIKGIQKVELFFVALSIKKENKPQNKAVPAILKENMNNIKTTERTLLSMPKLVSGYSGQYHLNR